MLALFQVNGIYQMLSGVRFIVADTDFGSFRLFGLLHGVGNCEWFGVGASLYACRDPGFCPQPSDY